MKRREFIASLLFSAVTPHVSAQQPAKVYRIAIVSPSRPVKEMNEGGSYYYKVFFSELRRLGYMEGQNLIVERYSGEGNTAHYAELAREVVRQQPDVILTFSVRMVRYFKSATTTIPIVGLMADPVAGATGRKHHWS
jgi:putative ABC transport system substrate-binding protein